MNYFAWLLLFSLSVLPGCGRVIEWGKKNFYQGEESPSYTQTPKEYICSVTVYDQLATQAQFDALWLSDAVRMAYVNAFADRTGKNSEQKNMLLRRELEENNHYITFYVLSLYNISLGDCLSEWSMVLKSNNQMYHPAEIKYVDLSPEFRLFFGPLMSRFKNVYQVRFDAKDVEGQPILTPFSKDIQLCFRSTKKDVALLWQLAFNDGILVVRKDKKPYIVRNQRKNI